MSTVLIFSDAITIFIKKDNSLSYLLSESIPISEETKKIVDKIPKYTGVSKLYNFDGAILLLMINGYLEFLYDKMDKLKHIFPNFNKDIVKNIFFYSDNISGSYLCYILYNNNTIRGFTRGIHKTLISHAGSADKHNVLAVDIDAISVQILKLDGTKIIFSNAGRTVMENIYDERLESTSYI